MVIHLDKKFPICKVYAKSVALTKVKTSVSGIHRRGRATTFWNFFVYLIGGTCYDVLTKSTRLADRWMCRKSEMTDAQEVNISHEFAP